MPILVQAPSFNSDLQFRAPTYDTFGVTLFYHSASLSTLSLYNLSFLFSAAFGFKLYYSGESFFTLLL
jgi:hypothetical protein